jgi:hypothetical protein
MTGVGFKLYREVLDFAPADVTSGELVVALIIADDANDATRVSWMSLPLLCARTRLKPSSVRAALAKLAARGYEFRVAHGFGKDGRPVFAAKGHAVDYVVPDMLIAASPLAPIAAIAASPLAPIAAREPVDNPPEGASPVAPIRDPKALASDSKALENSPKGASALAPLPSYPLTIPSTEEASAVNGDRGKPVDNFGQEISSTGRHARRQP